MQRVVRHLVHSFSSYTGCLLKLGLRTNYELLLSGFQWCSQGRNHWGVRGSRPPNFGRTTPTFYVAFFLGSRMLFHVGYFTCPFASKLDELAVTHHPQQWQQI